MRAMILGLLLVSSAYALTPAERKLVVRARAEVIAARQSIQSAQSEADQAWESADQADSRAQTAQHQAEVSQKAAVANKALLDKWQPQIDQDKRWFGLGRVIFGLADLAKHLLLLLAGIAVLTLVVWAVSFVFPEFEPVLAFLLFIPRTLLAKLKPKTS